jgi:hypothetical protein
LNGRAPNFSWSARVFADSWSKLPVMLGLPLVTAPWVTGAEMTWPSSTMANWLRGDSRATRRVEMSANCLVPSPSKTMFTAQRPVLAPCWFVSSPLVALAMRSPDTPTGPRRYFTEPSDSQVMRGWSSGAALLSLSALAQS